MAAPLLVAARSAIRSAMKEASSATHPSSADPRVCCHGSPRKVQTGDGGDAAAVLDAPVGTEDREPHEGVVETEAGRPDHRADGLAAAVGEDQAVALGARPASSTSKPPTAARTAMTRLSSSTGRSKRRASSSR